MKVRASASGSEEPTALKVTESPARTDPSGSMLIFAVGAPFKLKVSKHPANAALSNSNTTIGANPPAPLIVGGVMVVVINPTDSRNH